VTSLTSDQQLGNLLIAGCGDGAIRLYDKRLAPKDAMVLTFNEHPSWVINVHLQRGNERKLISGRYIYFYPVIYFSARMAMCGFGTRGTAMPSKLSKWRAWEASRPWFSTTIARTLQRTRTCHHCNNSFTHSGSQNQSIKVYDTGGDCVSTIRYHEGFFGQRIAPVNAMAFHPQKMVFAAGGMDQLISIYGVNKNSI
jgi:regulator-associated protein of mTOR